MNELCRNTGISLRSHQHGEAHTVEENIRRFKNANKTVNKTAVKK